ncbi:MAG: cyclic lactone autoinducer peptide [Clostridium sp.]|nr:cyclic lactone autoinducer peptide [Clostridium sp.]MCM1443918.1 cyclic lactone autoinducer peptide [Candidatus Amulumruptor caecigallinarius]
MLSAILSFLGFKAASVGSQACLMLVFDEPECPKSLIK